MGRKKTDKHAEEYEDDFDDEEEEDLDEEDDDEEEEDDDPPPQRPYRPGVTLTKDAEARGDLALVIVLRQRKIDDSVLSDLFTDLDVVFFDTTSLSF